MKPFAVFLLTTAFFLTTPRVQAIDSVDILPKLIFKMEKSDDQTITLRLSNLQQKKTTVTLRDEDGKVFFQEVIVKHNGYTKNLNLEEMSDGLYTIIIKHDDTKYARLIKVDNDNVLFSDIIDD